MREPMVWIWGLFALSALMLEVITAGFFVLPFGVGAGVAAVIALAGFGFAAQAVGMLIGTSASFAGLRYYVHKMQPQESLKVGPDRLIGAQGIVTNKIDQNVGTGEVFILSEEWQAKADSPLDAGTKVRVLRTEGTRLVVEPAALPVIESKEKTSC